VAVPQWAYGRNVGGRVLVARNHSCSHCLTRL